MADKTDARLPIVLGTLTLTAMLLVGTVLFFYVLTGPVPQPPPRAPKPAPAEQTASNPRTETPESPAADAPEAAPESPAQPRPGPRPESPQPVQDHGDLPPVPPEYRPRPVHERELPDGTIERVEHPPDLSGETRQIHRDLELTARLLQDALR